MASSPSDSPPSPPSTDSPPPQSSSSPPPTSSPPPSPPSSPPPPQSSPPPPSPSDSNSSPPPPPPKSSSSPPNQNSSPLPPPPPSSNSRGNASPPPPSLAPPKSHRSSPPAHTSSSNSGGNAVSVPVIIGVVAAAGFLLLIAMVALCFVCTKKKKKKTPHDQMQYYMDPPSRGNQYSQHGNNNWAQSPMDHSLKISPPPGRAPPGAFGALPPPPPPPGMVSSDMSSADFSGPHGPVLPPPHPSVALGFNKSTFTYDELAAATGGFAQGNLLGQGGFGYVHKGTLPNGKEIAVKSLKLGSGQGEREFQAEVDIISRVHHRHLVSLVGYCIAGGQRMLVYEFVPNNNLDHHIHGKGRAPLDWSTRLKIAMGSAKGLAYLHEDCHPRIIHRDIKTANILLDYSYEAKVADFGLAKLSQDNYTHVSTRVMGTFGYLAPEYASTGKLTEKSDVFSFGVMLLELITGRCPVDTSNHYMEDSLVDWARPLLSRALEDGNYDEFADPLMEKNYDPHEMARMVACAAASIRHSGRRRPKMSQIVRALEGDAVLDDLNGGVKPGQSSAFGSSSSEYDASSYSADMKKFRKMALDSQEYGSSEYGGTSEYGLHPSSSSNDSSREMVQNVGSRRRSP